MEKGEIQGIKVEIQCGVWRKTPSPSLPSPPPQMLFIGEKSRHYHGSL